MPAGTSRTGVPPGWTPSSDCPTRFARDVADTLEPPHPRVRTRPRARSHERGHGCRHLGGPCSSHGLHRRRCSPRSLSRASRPLRTGTQATRSHRHRRADRMMMGMAPHRLSRSVTTRPSTVLPQPCPLPLRRMPQLWPVGTTRARILFRPRGLSPPRRLAPRLRSQVCCTLQPVLGFTIFRASASWSMLHPARPSRSRTNPSKSLSSAAAPRHRGRCSLAVAPEPHAAGRADDPQSLDEPECSSPKAATFPARCGARRRSDVKPNRIRRVSLPPRPRSTRSARGANRATSFPRPGGRRSSAADRRGARLRSLAPPTRSPSRASTRWTFLPWV